MFWTWINKWTLKWNKKNKESDHDEVIKVPSFYHDKSQIQVSSSSSEAEDAKQI